MAYFEDILNGLTQPPQQRPAFGALAAKPVATPAPAPQPAPQQTAHAAPASSGFDDLATFLAGMGQGGGALLPALGAGARAVKAEGDRRTAINQTRDFLARNGVSPEDIDATMANPDLLRLKLGQMFAPKTMTVNPGQKIIDANGRVIIDNSEQPKPTPEQSNFRYSQENPEFLGFLNNQKRGQISVSEMTAEERATLAKQYGLDPNSDAGRSFILTGKLPREDQQMLTATDKKAILEADELVASTEEAIMNLDRALELSKSAYDGATANERAWITSQFGSDAGIATRELNQAVTETALRQLKAIFGGAPTEGERKILLEIQGSAELPQQARDNILRKARAAAERRLAFNRDRATQMRSGTFYKPQGGEGQQPAPSGVGGAPIRARNAQGQVIEWNGSQWVPVQ